MSDYIVETRFGITYNFIKSWKVWDIDASFLEFSWTEKNKVLIIKLDDIKVIKQV